MSTTYALHFVFFLVTLFCTTAIAPMIMGLFTFLTAGTVLYAVITVLVYYLTFFVLYNTLAIGGLLITKFFGFKVKVL